MKSKKIKEFEMMGNQMKKSQLTYLSCISVSLVGRCKFILTVLLSDEMFFDIDGDCLMVSLDSDDYHTVEDTTKNYIENVYFDKVDVDALIESCLNLTEWFEDYMTKPKYEEDNILPKLSKLLGGSYILQEKKIKGYRMKINE
ncbi:MAG: hypothetical protein KAS04_00505 [Candidatus Aenigmarchaeota archaeon]|nr:hypothetical protein [Candidatus Aenigmarchaeota archaeon]